MNDLIKYLGKLGNDLPNLDEKDWSQIFQFIEFFLTTENKELDFNWSKIMDILILLKKVK